MRDLHDFLQKLELLEWNPAGYIDPEVLALLAEVGGQPKMIRDAVNSWSPEFLAQRQLMCHETSTHYKWFLFYHDQLRYKIWLHQYKLPSERRAGYAEVPHNHRYSLASLVLRGGFFHHYFERTENGLVEQQQDSRSYSRGDTYVLDWRRIHKLSTLNDHTITLVVEGPAVRNFSEAFYDESAKPTFFYDFVGLYPRLSAGI